MLFCGALGVLNLPRDGTLSTTRPQHGLFPNLEGGPNLGQYSKSERQILPGWLWQLVYTLIRPFQAENRKPIAF